MPPPTASFGKFSIQPLGQGITFKPQPQTKYEEVKQGIKEDKENKEPTMRDIARAHNIAKVIRELEVGAVDCPRVNNITTPLFCCGCDRVNCMEYEYARRACEIAGIEPQLVWQKQRKYKKE